MVTATRKTVGVKTIHSHSLLLCCIVSSPVSASPAYPLCNVNVTASVYHLHAKRKTKIKIKLSKIRGKRQGGREKKTGVIIYDTVQGKTVISSFHFFQFLFFVPNGVHPYIRNLTAQEPISGSHGYVIAVFFSYV